MKENGIFNLIKGVSFALLWTFTLSLFAQNITVKGTITDASNVALIGVTVQIQGTTTGTVTDLDGNYVLNNVPANGALEISYVGMKSQTVSVNGQTTINVVLGEDTELLDELVVVGYGTMRKSDITG